MILPEIVEIARRIGQFYLDKFEGDCRKAEEAIYNVRIVKIEVVDDRIDLTTERPGCLIGKRGENVDALVKSLGKPVHIVEAENSITDLMMSVVVDKETASYDLGDYGHPEYDNEVH